MARKSSRLSKNYVVLQRTRLTVFVECFHLKVPSAAAPAVIPAAAPAVVPTAALTVAPSEIAMWKATTAVAIVKLQSVNFPMMTTITPTGVIPANLLETIPPRRELMAWVHQLL